MPPKDPSVQFFAYIPSVADVGVYARYRDNRGLGRDRLMIIVGLASIKDHTMLIIYHSDRDNLSILSLIILLYTHRSRSSFQRLHEYTINKPRNCVGNFSDILRDISNYSSPNELVFNAGF